MPLSLHAAFVPSALQMLGGTRHIVDKAEEWCAENSTDASELIGSRLADDMLAFDYQVKSVTVHTAKAIEGAKTGEFSPDMTPPPDSFDGMRTMLDDAAAAVEAVSEGDLEALIGKNVNFTMGGKVIYSFTAENFLLSFSQPNFYFHASTAYDILRLKGGKIGKLDFMGRLRGNPPSKRPPSKRPPS